MKPFSGSVIGSLHHIFFLGATHFGENLFPPKQKHMKRTRAQPAPPQKKTSLFVVEHTTSPHTHRFFWGLQNEPRNCVSSSRLLWPPIFVHRYIVSRAPIRAPWGCRTTRRPKESAPPSDVFAWGLVRRYLDV